MRSIGSSCCPKNDRTLSLVHQRLWWVFWWYRASQKQLCCRSQQPQARHYFCESLFWASQPKQAAKITWQLMPTAPQFVLSPVTASHHCKLDADSVTLPQMTWRRFGCNSRSPLALRTTGIQNYLCLPGTTSLRIRSPWLAAFADRYGQHLWDYRHRRCLATLDNQGGLFRSHHRPHRHAFSFQEQRPKHHWE